MPSSNAGAMSVRPELIGSAAGLSGALTGAGGALTAGITSMILHEANAAFVLLGMMLLSSTMALLAALFVLWLDVVSPKKIQLSWWRALFGSARCLRARRRQA